MTRTMLRTALMASLLVFCAPSAKAESPQQLVDDAKASLEAILGDANFETARAYIGGAKAVMIVPNLIKAGLIIGGEAGTGVALVRGSDGQWSDPAFYLLAAGSIGLQIGVESKQILFLFMTDKAVGSIMTEQIKLGADVSVTAGNLGGGVSASTVGSLRADIVAFSKSKGLFGGGALDGALIKPLADTNEAYYAKPVTPKQILMQRRVSNAGAVALKEALARY
jgi:lipid-binding SYLF domain-containing protein